MVTGPGLRRIFFVNARGKIITTVDQMLQELSDLKR